MGKRLDIEKRVALKAALANGATVKQAAKLIGVSEPTVRDYFQKWGWRPQRSKSHPRGWQWPAYTGPDWIGKPAR